MALRVKKFLITGMTPTAGGIEAYIMNLLRNIDNKKIQFDFLVNFEDTIAFENEILSYGCHIYRLPGRKKHPFFHYIQYNSFFKKYARHYDGIYCNLLSLTNIDDLCFASKNGISQIISHAHNNDDSGGSYFGIRPFLHRHHQIKANKISTILLSCSDSSGKWMFGSNAEFQVINNAIDTKKFVFNQQERDEIRKQNSIKPSTLVLGSVGRLETQKNPLFLVDIFRHIKEVHSDSVFLHVGKGSLYEEMRSQISKYGLEDSYLLMGEFENTSPFYSAMDIFVFPSLYEGLGISLIEAQASDVVCLVSDGIPKEAILLEDRCFSIPLKSSASDWAEQILQKWNLSEKQRKNNLKLIADKGFDIKTEIRRLESVICDETNKVPHYRRYGRTKSDGRR